MGSSPTKKMNLDFNNQTKPSTSSSSSFSKNKTMLDINDCTCAICLDVLIEPLLTPCQHEMCLECFQSMRGDSLRQFECPLCRRPCVEWAKKVAANGKMHINVNRWVTIKQTFGEEVRNKLSGRSSQLVIEAMETYKKELLEGKHSDDGKVEGAEGGHVMAEPGELRKEYLELLKKEEERIRLEREKEERESMELIQLLLVSFILTIFIEFKC